MMPALREAEEQDLWERKTSLAYIWNSRIAWTTLRDSVSKNTKDGGDAGDAGGTDDDGDDNNDGDAGGADDGGDDSDDGGNRGISE